MKGPENGRGILSKNQMGVKKDLKTTKQKKEIILKKREKGH